MRPRPFALAVLVAPALALALLPGCFVSRPFSGVPVTTTTTLDQHGPIDVDVASSNGRIAVLEDQDATGVTVVAQARLADADRAERFAVEALLTGDGTLRVRPLWPDGERLNNESCAFEVVTPAIGGVEASTSNGRITLRGARGDARLETSNGSVVVADHHAGLVVRTSNGRVEVSHSQGPLDLATSNGRIIISDASPGQDGGAGPWRAVTSNGSITLELAGPFAGTLTAATSNGRTRVERATPDGERRTIASGRSIELDLGPGEGTIDLRTSNGSITVVTGG